jgi:threonyl-tRNA synthetase
VHQCATVQLDFQLPIRFDLKYKSAVNKTESSAAEGADAKEEKAADKSASSGDKATEGFERPVMVHRAMLGSVERMFAVLTEHYGGKWPFWLSPRQVMIVPVHSDQYDYGFDIKKQLHDAGFYVEVDDSKNTFQKKVRTAQVEQYNFQLVIGKEEMVNGTVNIRTRANEVKGEMKILDFIELCKTMRDTFQQNC